MTVPVPRAIPLADAPSLAAPARRTAAVRAALALAAIALLGLCLLLARGVRARPTSYFASGGGLLVLDLSTSVDPQRYRRVARVLRTIVDTASPVGLVAFSDTAYEVLPPATGGEELRPLVRFFEPVADSGGRRTQGFGYLESPWSGSFRGGTRISSGLRRAREVIERDGLYGTSVLLVSDLDDSPFDLPDLTREVLRYEREGIALRVVPLFPDPADRAYFAGLVDEGRFVANDEILWNSRLHERRTLVGSTPVGLLLAAAALLLLLGANERYCRRLAWGRAA